MQALILKELSYNLVFLTTIMTVLVAGLAAAVNVGSAAMLCVYALLLLFISLFTAANLITEEREESTMEYLMSLPVSREAIWYAKLSVGVGMAVGFALLILGAGYLLRGPFLAAVWNRIFWWTDLYPYGSAGRMAGFLVTYALLPCAVGYFFSTVIDRLSTAVIGALGSLVLVEILLLAFTSGNGTYVRLLLCIGFVLASYFAWSRGTPFDNNRRLVWGLGCAAALAVWTVLVLLVF